MFNPPGIWQYCDAIIISIIIIIIIIIIPVTLILYPVYLNAVIKEIIISNLVN